MPIYDFRLTAIIQALENGLYLGEALFFPEVSRLAQHSDQLLSSLESNAAKLAEAGQTYRLYRRRYISPPSLDQVVVVLEPPEQTNGWRVPVRLTFDVVRFDHGNDAHIAFVPALGIEALVKDRRRVHAEIEDQIRSCLLRTKKSSSLLQLLLAQRSSELQLIDTTYHLNVRTPKQLAADTGGEQKKKVVEEAGTDLVQANLPPAFEIDDIVERLAEALLASDPRPVLLVGPSGAGKTAAVYELVRRRERLRLGRTPFWETTGSRLVAGMSGFGMWEERCSRLWREASKGKAVVYFGNLLELMEVGKSVSSSLGIAGFFRPYLSRGDFVAIAECTPEQLGLIEPRDPRLLEAFIQIEVEEPDVARGRAILLSAAVALNSDTWIEAGALETLDRLHRRYATYSAYPGRPLRFLKNLFRNRSEDKPVDSDDVSLAFSAETGLPSFLLNESEPLDLAATTDWFRERVVGQEEAVNLVVDLMATIKSGMARRGRPLASFLFIGPTGVGKTEMARSLAQFLFRDSSASPKSRSANRWTAAKPRIRRSAVDTSRCARRGLVSFPLSIEALLSGSASG